MSDREAADLAAIMSDAPASPAPEPTDGSPPDPVSADGPQYAEDPLSVEEAVAAELRRGLPEGQGDELDAAPDEDDPQRQGPDLSDPEVQRALANEAMQWRQWKTVEDARAQEGAVVSEANNYIAYGRQHFQQERVRLIALLDERAMESPEPDLFKRQQLPVLLDGIEAQERTWIQQQMQERDGKINEIRETRAKPLAAIKMAREHGLPDAAAPELMRATTLQDMLNLAQAMQQARERVESGLRQADQYRRKGLNDQIRANNLHPGGSGAVRNAKPYQYKGTEEELKHILGGL